MCRSFIGCVVFPRKSFISGCWTEPPAALTVLCCWIPVSSLSCVGVCKGRLIFKVPGGFDLSVVVWIHLKPHKMQPEEVMLPLFSLMQRLEHLPNFNSFFCLRPFHSHFWLICWETLSSACWVLSWVLKLPHFQAFSCVSEPLDLKASLSSGSWSAPATLKRWCALPVVSCRLVARCSPGLWGGSYRPRQAGPMSVCSAHRASMWLSFRMVSLPIPQSWPLLKVKYLDSGVWKRLPGLSLCHILLTGWRNNSVLSHIGKGFMSNLALRSLFLQWTPSLSSPPAPTVLVPSLALKALERKIWRHTLLLSLSSWLVSVAPSFSHWLLWTMDLAKRDRTIHCGYCGLR